MRDVSADRTATLQETIADIERFAHLHADMTQWLAQKERMCALLGPMATEPSMVATQVEQVRALQEEVTSQSDRFDACLQSGMTLLDRCDPQTSDAHGLNKQVQQVRVQL